MVKKLTKKVKTYSGTTNSNISEREIANRKIAKLAAAEGIVLLKNDNNVLPLQKSKKVALFGGGACKTVKGGTGSGDVNEREVITILEGMLNCGFEITTTKWLDDYKKEYHNTRLQWKELILKEESKKKEHFFDIYSRHPFQMPSGRKIEQTDLQNAQTDTIVYVISRVAGEAADRYEKKGDYYLTDREYENLKIICEYFSNIILILNTGSQIDLSFLEEFNNISSILYMVQAGMEGGNAVADLLCANRVPCGKLTDTWANKYSDYPASATFSHNNQNVLKEYYNEGIYVGYRYFDSFGIKPRFSFGYGLSYTQFEVTISQMPIYADENNQSITITANIKNTGSTYSGKEVLQIYISCPQTKLEKEFRRLCGFAKTKVLKPQEEKTVEITFPVKAMASFDEEKRAWIAEKGLYGIWIGTSLQETKLIGAISVENNSIIEKVNPICPLQENERELLKEIKCPAAKRKEFEDTWHKEIQKKNLPIVAIKVNEEKKLLYPKTEAKKMAEKLVEKLTIEELTAMIIGEISKGQEESSNNALGSAGIMVPGAAGETSSILDKKYNIPGMTMADGPAGLRLAKKYDVEKETGNIYPIGFLAALEGGLFDKKEIHENAVYYYQYCTSIPVGTLLAQTWDVELVEKVGLAVAKEMQEFNITWWLAPGMNIHRDPLCGRNFEYYSEDPLISGSIAAAITKGVQSENGVGTTIKHFACNNQEDNRKGSDSILSERVLREIYLKGFEIAVKTAQPMAVMTSYNKINGVHTANSYDLCTETARKEWGFQGIIMTDWTTTNKEGGSIAYKCIAAGNDLIMPGSYSDIENITKALETKELAIEDLKACVERLLTIAYQSNCYLEAESYGKQFEKK